MTQRQKLLDKMRNSPGSIRFSEVDSVLKHEGFVLFNQRGSHRTYHHQHRGLITIVVLHGRRNTCHPGDIRKLLEILEI